jgi:hypothetical protein
MSVPKSDVPTSNYLNEPQLRDSHLFTRRKLVLEASRKYTSLNERHVPDVLISRLSSSRIM